MKSALVIINKSSGSNKKSLIIEKLKEKLSLNNYKSKIEYTTKDIGSKKIISDSVLDTDLIVAIGGDGTISDVVNQMHLQNSNLPLAVIPTGTANDFARVNSIPLDPIKAIEALQLDTYKKVDIIKINERYGSYLIAFGNFMTGFAKVPSNSKRSFGRLAYLGSALKVIIALKKYRVYLKTDQLDMEVDSVFTLVSSISSVGSLENLIPEAKADDGLLHILNILPIKITEVPKILYLALRGRISEHPKVIYLTSKSLLVSSNKLSDMNIDGDLYDYEDSHINIIGGGLTLIECKSNPQ